jgi:predicted O-methyltransferase YrrM
MSEFADALAAIDGVAGWLTAAQARLLFERASALRPGARIVEIGSYHGRSTIVLARAAPEAEVVAIDPYVERCRGPHLGERSLERFQENVERAGVHRRVRHVRAFSSDALPAVVGEIDLLYIDGAHELAPALADIRSWGARVRDGGTMLVHDAFSSIGVTLAQIVELFFGREFRYVGRSRSLAEYRREQVHGFARASSAARQAAQLPWFVRNVLVKIALRTNARPVARALGHDGDVFPY